MGYAVVEEVISPDVRGTWARPLQSVKDPINALIGIVQRIPVRPEDVCGGCQLNNLGIMKRRTNNDKDRSIAQESARNGSRRGVWSGEPVGAGKCQRNGGQDSTNEEIVRKWYAAWEKKDWGPVDSLLADNFAFTSAAGDDHISKNTFKARCWETQIDFIGHFDLERITTGADDAFVKYLCHTKDGKSFRNVEYLRIKNGKLQSIECYFGAQSSFPSAVSTGQN